MVTQALNAFGAGTALNPVLQSLLDWIAKQDELRRDDYDRARAYYSGDQSVKLTDRLKKYLQNSGMEYRDNFCELVVDTLAERLSVIGFAGPNEAASALAFDLWKANRMDYQQTVVHTEAIMLGDAYLMVDWDEERQMPRFTPQRAEMIIPHYNEATQKIDWLSKKWVEQDMDAEPVTRLNLYYPDRIEKYRARGGVWVRFDEEDEIWPVPWVDSRGRPIGVTTIHFRNKPLSSFFGQSELHNVIPSQDLLNKTMVDLSLMLDTQVFGQRYTVNIAHGNSRIDVVPGSVAEFHSEPDMTAEVGEFAAASPEGSLAVIEMIVQHIAGVSRTPQYLFQLMGGQPSGEALKTAESGLVKKALRRQVNFGNAWEDVMIAAFRVQAAFGNGPNPDGLALDTLWDDPESRNEESHINGLKVKAELGVPKRQIWRELGYDDDTIEQMEQDIQDEQVRDTNLGAAILQRFSSGEV